MITVRGESQVEKTLCFPPGDGILRMVRMMWADDTKTQVRGIRPERIASVNMVT